MLNAAFGSALQRAVQQDLALQGALPHAAALVQRFVKALQQQQAAAWPLVERACMGMGAAFGALSQHAERTAEQGLLDVQAAHLGTVGALRLRGALQQLLSAAAASPGGPDHVRTAATHVEVFSAFLASSLANLCEQAAAGSIASTSGQHSPQELLQKAAALRPCANLLCPHLVGFADGFKGKLCSGCNTARFCSQRDEEAGLLPLEQEDQHFSWRCLMDEVL
ncbi:hypothetical protein ABPG75_002495 [Micractinium tetrahymenae]